MPSEPVTEATPSPATSSQSRRVGARRLLVGLKIVVSVALLTLVLRHAGVAAVLERAGTANPAYLALTVLLGFLTIVFGSMRWRRLVGAADGGTPLTAWLAFRLNLIGSFFNLVSPGRVAGDAMRAFYLYRHRGDPAVSAASVVVDRSLALGTLLALGLIALIWVKSPLATGVLPLVLIGLFTAGVILLLLALWLRPGQRFATLAAVYRYLDNLLRNSRTLLVAVGLSALIQLLSIAAAWSTAQALGLPVAFLEFMLIMPPTVIAASLPVTVGGLGVREGAFVLLLGQLGIGPGEAVATSLLWYLCTLTATLPGAALFMLGRARSQVLR